MRSQRQTRNQDPLTMAENTRRRARERYHDKNNPSSGKRTSRLEELIRCQKCSGLFWETNLVSHVFGCGGY